jgi:hypothetical protein
VQEYGNTEKKKITINFSTNIFKIIINNCSNFMVGPTSSNKTAAGIKLVRSVKRGAMGHFMVQKY